MSAKQKLKDFLKRFLPLPAKKQREMEARILDELETLKNQLCYRSTQSSAQEPLPCMFSRHVDERIVVSLTTYPARFGSVCETLRSLLRQTLPPDRIVVYLDVSEGEITGEMRNMAQFGVEWRFGCENLKPHKKYFFAMQEFPDFCVVTVDDDIVYPPTLLESLWRTHKNHPDCVAASRVHKMTFDESGNLKPYGEWIFERKSETEGRFDLFATNGAGSLFPPHILPAETFDSESIKKFCLEADDVWLKFMELKAGVKTVWAANSLPLPAFVEGSQNVGLCFSNVGKCENDKFIKKVLDFCGKEEIMAKLRGEAKK